MRLWQQISDAVFPPRPTRRRVDRLVSLMHESSLRLIELRSPVTAILPYRNPDVQACIIETKYHDHRKARKLLAAVLAEYLHETIADLRAYDASPLVLVPIPLSAHRRRSRGYNQVEAICREAVSGISSALIRIDSSLLLRTRDTVPQTRLARIERLANMQGAFRASQALESSTTYIVIDDVVTTGATLHAAVAALEEAGATRIIPLALAH